MSAVDDFDKQAGDLPIEGKSDTAEFHNNPPDSKPLSYMVEKGAAIPPDTAAQVLKAQQQTGLPQDVVARNLDAVTAKTTAGSFDAEAFQQNNPVVSDWVSQSPHHAAVAQDDLHNLGAIEGAWNDILRPLKFGTDVTQNTARMTEAGFYGLKRSYLGIKALTGTPGPDDEKELGRTEKAIYDINQNKMTGVGGLPGQLAEQLPAIGVAMGAGVLSGGIGAPAAFGLMSAGDSYLDYRKIKTPEGKPIDDTVARGAATAVGVLTGLTFKIPMEQIASKFPGLKMLLGDGMGEILKNPTTASAMTDYVKHVGLSGATMGGFNFIQNMIRSNSDDFVKLQANGQLARMSPMQILSHILDPQKVQQALESIPSGVVLGAGLGGLTGMAGLYSGMERATRATDTAKAFENMANGIRDSKLSQRLPEGVQEIVARMTHDSEMPNVYHPLESFQQFAQSKNVDPRDLAKEIGITGSYDEALRTGQDIQIPTDTFAIKMAASDDGKFFMQEIRRDPNEMNAREASEYLKTELPKADQAATEGDVKKPGLLEETALRVRQDVAEKLEKAGYRPDIAGHNAELAMRGFRQMAIRNAMDPWELYQKYGLAINRMDQPFEAAVPPEETAIRERAAEMLKSDKAVYDDQKATYDRWKEIIGKGVKKAQDVVDEMMQIPKQFRFEGEGGRPQDEVAQEAREKGLLAEHEDFFQKMAGLKAPQKPGKFEDYVSKAREEFMGKQLAEGETGLMQSPSKKTQTPEFKNWFGRSKVVDEEGNPLVVYHGTREDFSKFDQKKAAMGGIIWFSSNPETANVFAGSKGDVGMKEYGEGGNVKPLYVSIKNPAGWEEYEKYGLGQLKSMGYDGVILKDKDGSFTGFVFDNKQIKSSIGNKGTFNPNNPNILKQGESSPLGMLRFGNNRQMNIDILKGANLSTFLHETGHLFLEVMGDVAGGKDSSDAFKADYAKILDYVGVKDRSEIATEHHEKFADAFTTYLREGKAPSVDLQPAFARFRSWLISVYQTLKINGVSLTPEVRGVFDRLVASDEEIKYAQMEQGMRPLFDDPRKIGMTESQAQQYSKAVTEAKESAESDLMSKLMKSYEREHDKIWQAERDKVEADVTEQVNKNKDMIAKSMLKKGVLPDDSALPEAFKGLEKIKLSQADIKDAYPEQDMKLLRGYTAREGGIHPDAAAEVFGFPTGKALLNALANKETREDRIKTLTDQYMESKYGDPMKDGTLPELAQKAVHNEKRSQLLRKELEYLASDNLPAFKSVIRRVARRIPSVEAVRFQAEAMIGSKMARDIKPSMYQRAEALASREAVEHMLRGDMDSAFEAKQRELLNNELYRAATNAKDDINDIVDYMKRFDKPSVRDRVAAGGKGGFEGLEQIDQLLDRFDFRKSTTLTELGERKDLSAWVLDQRAQGYDDSIPPKFLDEAFRQHYKDTTYEELSGLRDTVKNIEHIALQQGKLLANEKFENLRNAKEELAASIRTYHDVQTEKREYVKTFSGDMVKNVKHIMAEHTRMEWLFNLLDGGKPNGTAWNLFYRPLDEAFNAESGKRRDAMQALNDIFGVYSTKEKVDFFKREHIAEIDGTMIKPNLLMVAGHMGNAYNREALMKGEGWTSQQLDAVASHISAKDWDVVQKLADHINSYWPEIATMEKKINGIAPEKVQGDAFAVKTSDGQTLNMKGWYWPILFDKDASWRTAQLAEKESIQDMFGGGYARAMTKHGFTEERTNSGGKPLLLNLSALTDHLSNVIHDLTHREAVIDAYKLINDPEVRNDVSGAAGKELYKQLNPWLSAIASDKRGQPVTHMEGLMGRARMGMTVASIGFRTTSALVHTLSYGMAAQELGGEYAAKGIADAYAHPGQIGEKWEFIKERSEQMRNREMLIDRDLRDTMGDLNIKGMAGPMEAATPYLHGATKAYFSLLGAADLSVSIPSWLGAYRKAMDGAVEDIDKGNEKDAIAYADSVVRMTKGSGAMKDLAAVQKGSPEWKLFTMFYSPMSVVFNNYQKYAKDFSMDRDFHKVMTAAVLTWFIPAALHDVIRGQMPSDDEKDHMGRYLAGKIAAYPMESVIILRDLIGALELGRKDVQATPFTEVMQSALNVARAGAGRLTGEKDELSRSDFKSMATVAGVITAMPTRQAWITSEYLYDWMVGNEQPDNPMEGLWRAAVGKGHKP